MRYGIHLAVLVVTTFHGLGACLAAGNSPAYPLKPSVSGRYLVDQNDVPFMILGDSPQAAIGKLSPPDADWYFANRQAHGFNTLWINLLCNGTIGCNADGTTFDGIAPFLSTGDLATPNQAYFERVDEMLQLAAKHGLLVMLDPAETSGWLDALRANGTKKVDDFGVYLGQRYKDFPNIIWLSGNDFQSWRSEDDDALVLALAHGIRSVDRNHIHTVELDYETSSSLDDHRWASVISLNAAYTYFPTYAEVLHAYNQSGSMPVFMVEANYEFENGSLAILRRQAYWTALSGATGQLYGSKYTWQFPSGWQNKIDTVGVAQLGHLKTLFAGRPWHILIPDQGHQVVTDGYGTFSGKGPVGTNDYVTTASTPDGRLVVAYLPTVRPVTVDMTKLVGRTVARWFDPTAGTFWTIGGSPFDNQGSRQFLPPGRNHDGQSDWLLVLEVPH
jgi:Protein of unknown function (DUF4038)/Putative collagen-binding domain of a collagenase